ncbi:ABC-type Fe3+ transport system, periplasmic component [Longilinea arvoryzae]|uniref:ABC-type Fe3+ transport system, periplasmic component n=1 Tax=Longilinea arvoryzae TaxID=360412 RepID=A0A0K8MXW8_9CHLR|nr:ABC transporter substrate-binding protein [Longilinea arvoryzae]GAP16055.1 ABC-type Fe3+ transport system, periplasmic component [Longilinea arvoryzae]
MSRRIIVSISIMVVATILAACSNSAAPTQDPVSPTVAPATEVVKTEAAATEAPTLDTSKMKLTVLCGPQEDWCIAATKAFQEKTGIATNYVRLSSGEAIARLSASKDNPEFDVWWGGPVDGYQQAKDQGLVQAYGSPNAAQIADNLKDPDGYWTGIYVGALGFCSNTAVLKNLGVDVPESWDDLLDPALKGQVAMAHPATSGTAFTAFWTVNTLNNFDQEATFAYFKKLHNNILQYTKTGSAPGPMAGRGEIGVAIIFSHDCVMYQKQGMTDLKVSFPAEGTGYEIGGVAIINGTPNLDAAKMWVDWSLTAEAQEIAATVGSYQLPTNPDATVPPEAVKLSTIKLVDYDFVASAAAKKALTERFDADIAPAPKE